MFSITEIFQMIRTSDLDSDPMKRTVICDSLCLTVTEGNGTPLQFSCLENPWTQEPGRLQSMGSLRVGHD